MALVAVPADDWVSLDAVDRCELCRLDFSIVRRKHYCQLCGHVFCGKCSDFWGPPLRAPGGEQTGSRETGQETLERRCRRCFEAFKRSQKEAAAEAVQAAATAAAAERAAEQHALTQQHARIARIEAAVIDTGRSFAHGLPSIGRRTDAEKSYFLCRQRSEGKEPQEVLLALVKPNRRNLRMGDELRDFILGLQHPFVMPVIDLMFFPEAHDSERPNAPISLGIFRSVAAWGSLRDVLHSGADPALPADDKYATARRLGSPLPQQRLALYGRQILEAIAFLQSVWVSCAGVTTANVLVLGDDWCVVTDWENDLLGMRSSSTRHDWLATRPHPAVYAFGHILYEMATGGTPLQSNTLPSTLQGSVPVSVLQVLDTIFNYPVGDKFEALDVVSLLALPFFDTVVLRDRHLRLLVTPAAVTATQRQLLSECGFVPTSTAKKEERAARRRARDFSHEAKANRRYGKEARRLDRMARRLRHQTRKNERAVKRSGTRRGGQALHCVEFQSTNALGLELESILHGSGPGDHQLQDGPGDVTVVGVELGGQAEKLGVQVGMVLLTVSGVGVVDPNSGLPRSVGEVLAMVNAARQSDPNVMLEFACPPPPTAEDVVMLIDPTEPMGLELADALQAGEEDSRWKVRCVSVVPGSQADDYRLELPCILTYVGGRSVVDRSFDYVLSVLELARDQAVESKNSLELRFQAMSKHTQWVTEPEERGDKMDDVTRHVFVNSEPLGIELAEVKGDVQAIAIHPGGQGDLLGVPQDRILASVQDEAVLGRSFQEIVGMIQDAKSQDVPLTLGFQALIGTDPILAAISSDPSSPLDISGASANKANHQHVVSGFALSARETLGLELQESPPDEWLKAQVIGCVPKSAAHRFGVARGSLIAAIQGESCEGMGFDQIVTKLSAAKAGADALFGIADYVCIQFVSPRVRLDPRPREDENDADQLGQVAGWLQSIGMSRHSAVFEDNAITEMELVEELGEPQLKEMGIGAVERRLLLRAIRDWSQMGREEAKRAAAAATEAEILKLHRENAELRAKLSTAASEAQWAETQAAQLQALRAQHGDGGELKVAAAALNRIREKKEKKERKNKRKEKEKEKPESDDVKRAPMTEPRLDGSRRRDEVADALEAQDQAVIIATSRTIRQKANKEEQANRHYSADEQSRVPMPIAEPQVDDSWLDDTNSDTESVASDSTAFTNEYSASNRSKKKTVVQKQRTSGGYSRPKTSIFEAGLESDDTTEDETDGDLGWRYRERRQSSQSIGESSVHSSLFGGTDSNTSIASSSPFGIGSDSEDGSVLSTAVESLPPTKSGGVPTLKGSNLNTANGLGMPKFGLNGDDAGMFDLASDDDSDDESIPSSFASFGKPSTGRPIGSASAEQARAILFEDGTSGTLFKD